MLYKPLFHKDEIKRFDHANVTVMPYEEKYYAQVVDILLSKLPPDFKGINEDWVEQLFRGYRNQGTGDINLKHKLLFVAVDRQEVVQGVAAATPKKGAPIKLMPFLAVNPTGFFALVADMPHLLRRHGRKVYAHLSPDVDETMMLQRCGWQLDGVLPGGYQDGRVTQQWSRDIDSSETMRPLRVKQEYLEHIKQGRKTLEVRVKYRSLTNLEAGEKIQLESRTERRTVRLKSIREYSDFTKMLENEDYRKIVPGLSKTKVEKLLREIYPPSKEQLGVLVLEIVLLDG